MVYTPTDTSRPPLTVKEMMALQGAAHGWDSFALARAEGRSPKSIRSRWERARRKLGANSTEQAILLAMRDGLFQ